MTNVQITDNFISNLLWNFFVVIYYLFDIWYIILLYISNFNFYDIKNTKRIDVFLIGIKYIWNLMKMW